MKPELRKKIIGDLPKKVQEDRKLFLKKLTEWLDISRQKNR